jgi:hypothetical protein
MASRVGMDLLSMESNACKPSNEDNCCFRYMHLTSSVKPHKRSRKLPLGQGNFPSIKLGRLFIYIPGSLGYIKMNKVALITGGSVCPQKI